jgi:hypothetical protein
VRRPLRSVGNRHGRYGMAAAWARDTAFETRLTINYASTTATGRPPAPLGVPPALISRRPLPSRRRQERELRQERDGLGREKRKRQGFLFSSQEN